MSNTNRREFFSSLFGALKASDSKSLPLIRPPYYSDISLFEKICLECAGSCAKACEEQIVEILDNKTPKINLKLGGCTYCDLCALACEYGVLNVADKRELDVRFKIDKSRCLSWSGTMCYSCKDACLQNAVELVGMFKASINHNVCNSCGFCIRPCPSDAIDILEV